MHPLMLHLDCTPRSIKSVTANLRPTKVGCDAEFRLEGDIHGIKVPPHAASARRDNLWKTTCFEIFWQPVGGTYYREFNLSPSGQWAAYDFDDFRKNSCDAPVDAISISCSHSDTGLMLTASIASELPLPAQVALNAIVETSGGELQFWALAFSPGQPEFHSEACRQKLVYREDIA